jgi:general L-amino acid transport system substrate-binding protein
MLPRFAIAMMALAGLLAWGHAEAADTLSAVKARGHLNCGVARDTVGFMRPDAQGTWRGFSVDICHAIAAALFGDSKKVRFFGLAASERFKALQAGEIDVLAANSTYTLERDTTQGADFVAIYWYDGQGVMVPRKLGKRSLRSLDGASICVQRGTTSEENIADYFARNKLTFEAVPFEGVDATRAAFFAGKCDVLTADISNLYATRAAYASDPSQYLILAQAISKEPLGLAVKQGDHQFADIVRWSFFAMVEAEEFGINSRNVDSMLASEHPAIKRLLGVTPGAGKALGVDETWALAIIKQVGNYDEVFERNLGRNTALKLPRGLNRSWREGGLLYSPPIR